MPSGLESADTVLIVDDEESVRKTFWEWLESANLGCRILSAADAESALVQANQTRIDIRSRSRVWRHDFGANAARVQKYAAEVQDLAKQK